MLGEADSRGYRRPLPGFSTNAAASSANEPRRARLFQTAGLTGGMDRTLPEGDARRLPDLGIALKSILGFWLLYMALITLRAIIVQYPDFWAMLARARRRRLWSGRRSPSSSIWRCRPVARRGLDVKAARRRRSLCLPAVAAVLGVQLLHLLRLRAARRRERWIPAWENMSRRSKWRRARSIESSLQLVFPVRRLGGLLRRDELCQAAARSPTAAPESLAREAQEAQLRALRYQINPHFLFNTLNSLSSLILSQKTDVAERMLMNLSTFFRATLSADPTADVPLEEEIKLQRLYLDIEQIRFPDRLSGRGRRARGPAARRGCRC